ncbi:MAG: MFS transporter [Chloroflexi bacterium]|nr:MFS transporter [Chloroflexota bacterium]
MNAVESKITGNKLPLREVLGYIFGRSFFSTINNTVIPVYLLYFFTNVFGLNIAVAGALMATIKIVEAVAQILTSYIIDHTHTKWGQAKPYILAAGVPVGVLTFLLFSVPNLQADQKVLYAYVVYIGYAIAAALYGSANALMVVRMTRDDQERNKTASLYGIIFGIASFVVTVWFMPIVAFLGGGEVTVGFSIFSGILGAFIAIGSILTFFMAKERVKIEPHKINFIEEMKVLAKNKWGLFFILNSVLYSTAINVVAAVSVYAVYYLIADPSKIMIIYAAVLIAYPIMSALYIPILKKISKIQLMLILSIFSLIAVSFRYMLPTNVILCIVGAFAMACMDNTFMVQGNIMVTETIDEIELKYNRRNDAFTFSLNGLFGRLAYAALLVVSTNHLQSAGFDANAATQSATAFEAIRLWFNVPLIITSVTTVIGMFIMRKFAKGYPVIHTQLEQKRLKEQAELNG